MSLKNGDGTDRASRLKAFRDGFGAYRDGRSIGSLPHVGQEAADKTLRHAWVEGYQRARRQRAQENAASS